MSMKNKDTWSFAHHYCGKLWWLLGWGLFAVTIIGMAFLIGEPENIVGTLGGIICGMQLVFLVGSIFPTEIALKRTFDENGSHRT